MAGKAVLGKDDLFPFGKYKNTRVSDILVENVGYAMWIRAEKWKSEAHNFFDKEVNGILDNAIKSNPSKFKQYRSSSDLNLDKNIEGLTTPPDRESVYNGEWGSF